MNKILKIYNTLLQEEYGGEDDINWDIEPEPDDIKDIKPQKQNSTTTPGFGIERLIKNRQNQNQNQTEKPKLRWVKRRAAGEAIKELARTDPRFKTQDAIMNTALMYRQFIDENPNVKLLILYKGDEPVGRALLWNSVVNDQKRTVMDAIYPVSARKHFERYAERKNIYVSKGDQNVCIRFMLEPNDIVKFKGSNITIFLQTFKILNTRYRCLQTEACKKGF